MNAILWILQVLLALHTTMGAVWKVSHSENAVPSLAALPHPLWLAMSVLEFLAALALVSPVASKRLGRLVPIAAVYVIAEMLVFTVVHLTSGATAPGEIVYWLVVAALSGFIAWGRLVKRPLG
jgi:hypothetical protein